MESTLWQDRAYRMTSYFEFYHDTPDFDLMKAGKFLYCWSKQTDPSEELWTWKEDCTRTINGRITFRPRMLSREEVKSILGELFDRCIETCAISFDGYQHPKETHYYDIATDYKTPTTSDEDTRAHYYAVRSFKKFGLFVSFCFV